MASNCKSDINDYECFCYFDNYQCSLHIARSTQAHCIESRMLHWKLYEQKINCNEHMPKGNSSSNYRPVHFWGFPSALQPIMWSTSTQWGMLQVFGEQCVITAIVVQKRGPSTHTVWSYSFLTHFYCFVNKML